MKESNDSVLSAQANTTSFLLNAFNNSPGDSSNKEPKRKLGGKMTLKCIIERD